MQTITPRSTARLGALLLLTLLTTVAVYAQGGVRIVVDRDFVNIRIVPAIGAELVGTANAGTTFVATGRSPDNQWYQIQFAGGEAWIGAPVVVVLEGNPDALPIRDPRTIPYGGAEAPRAGFTSASSDISARLPNSGVRVRSGPSTAYPVLADAPRFSVFPLLGRTANNSHVQVNFEGTLGWIPAQFIEIQDNRNITELTIDGVVASSSPLRFEADNEFFGILRLMRDRLDIAQVSLNEIKQVWTDAALGITPVCGGYPARPTNFNIPRQIYAEYFALLDPLLRDYNGAMTDLRASIDLLIETCQRPGAAPVLISPPVTTGGLEFANNADIVFEGLRRRLDELIPELGPDDCVFAFGGRVDVLPTLPALASGTAETRTDRFTRTEFTKGYCFDASPLNVGRIELVRSETNYGLIIAVAPLDDPTNFIATASAGPSTLEGANLIVFPISFPKEGRYLLIVNAQIEEDTAPEGDFTLFVTDFSFGTPSNAFLTLDEEGNVVFQDVTFTTATGETGVSSIEGGTSFGTSVAESGGTVTTTGTVTNTSGNPINVYDSANTNSPVVGTLGISATARVVDTIVDWYFVELDNGVFGWVQQVFVTFTADAPTTTSTDGQASADQTTNQASTDQTTASSVSSTPQPNQSSGALTAASSPVQCPGITLTCDQLFTCVEVQACLEAGSSVLDPNGNGVACDASDGLNPLGCNLPVGTP